MKGFLKKNLINITVALTSLLLITDIVLTYYNNKIIKHNRQLQIETETTKLYAEQIGKSTIHGIDIGVRGYAIFREDRFFTPVDSAIYRRDSILSNVESRLRSQGYNLKEFNALRDSVNSYIKFALHLKQLLVEKNDAEFYRLFGTDKGLILWWQYLAFIKNTARFEDGINLKAQQNYEAALNRNYALQILLFLICFPTLLYTAYHTNKKNHLTELLREAEADKNEILIQQNKKLEMMVSERTQEISSQNEELIQQQEEIAAQRDALSTQNQILHDAQKRIEDQNLEIQSENDRLEIEVNNRTQQLQHTNKELIDQNNQLEQFAFISSHNLRAPLARILGLSHILELSNTTEERDLILSKITLSTQELDRVITDLNLILEIRKSTGNAITEVDLSTIMTKILKALEKECEETGTVFNIDFTQCTKVSGVLQYVENILFNLISNSIKYRHPSRSPVINISTLITGDNVCLKISDNGLGLNLDKYKQDVFGLYKRFHFHVDGKGLGLYLVKTQVTALGGKIKIESEPEKGTTFYVYLNRFTAA